MTVLTTLSWTGVADVVGLALLFLGALLCLASAIGIVRLDGLFMRMHAASKPQVLGVLLVLAGLALRLRSPFDLGMLFLVGVFQLFTVPASSHMLARAHHRMTQRTKSGESET
ncbi:monovalent cation/H(+) antiporter subunit G [Mariniluteicoccus endophyticus]